MLGIGQIRPSRTEAASTPPASARLKTRPKWCAVRPHSQLPAAMPPKAAAIGRGGQRAGNDPRGVNSCTVTLKLDKASTQPAPDQREARSPVDRKFGAAEASLRPRPAAPHRLSRSATMGSVEKRCAKRCVPNLGTQDSASAEGAEQQPVGQWAHRRPARARPAASARSPLLAPSPNARARARAP